jgi:hypothetical protein
MGAALMYIEGRNGRAEPLLHIKRQSHDGDSSSIEDVFFSINLYLRSSALICGSFIV